MKAQKEVIKTAATTSITPSPAKQKRTKTAAKPDASEAKVVAEAKGSGSKGKLGALFGHSIVSVIRCLGKEGWTFEQAEEALKKAGITAATHTIKIGLKRGRDGQKRIAPLSVAELATLRGTPAKTKKSKRTAPVVAEAPVATEVAPVVAESPVAG